jgi:mycothiol synthase
MRPSRRFAANVGRVPQLDTAVPDDATRRAVLRLAAEIEAADGAPPLSDQALTRLGAGDVRHVVARDRDRVVGYAQRDGDAAEIAAEPAAVTSLLDAVRAPGLLLWTHGRRSRLAGPLADRGFDRIRELHQLRRPLTDLPPEPPVPEGVVVRPFRPGADDAAWLAVNAAAFARHPEQGRWTQADLDARKAESWFDPAGFLVAERAGAMLGYHWTKVHPDGAGEVYVLGVAPEAQGLGLGNALLVRGLRHLAEGGAPEVLLYVDGDNPGALRLYERAGFTRYDLDVQWRGPAG